jgi:hypothetical protein
MMYLSKSLQKDAHYTQFFQFKMLISLQINLKLKYTDKDENKLICHFHKTHLTVFRHAKICRILPHLSWNFSSAENRESLSNQDWPRSGTLITRPASQPAPSHLH